MPYYEDYTSAMKSDIADLKNTGGRPAGTLTAAAFLREFADKTPWLHLDIAGNGLSRKRVALAGEGPDGNARARLLSLVESLAALRQAQDDKPEAASGNGARSAELKV